MKTLEPILAEHPFLRDLPANHVSLLVGCASNVVFKPRAIIFREGDPADRFFIIRDGDVGVELNVPGAATMTIATIPAGEILGWSWLVPPHRCAFTARAASRVRAIAFDGACLREKCERDPALGYELLKRVAMVMADRLQSARLQLLDLYETS